MKKINTLASDINFLYEMGSLKGHKITKHWDREHILKELHTSTANNMWYALQSSDPQIWHVSVYKK